MHNNINAIKTADIADCIGVNIKQLLEQFAITSLNKKSI
jgi:hypothetical protein